MDAAPGAVRIDSWLWAVRLAKTRSAATALCRGGHVRINSERVKPAQKVHVGDEVRVRIAGFDRIVTVSRLITKRVSATVAADSLVERTPPRPERTAVPAAVIRDRGAGRPTKRERRQLDDLRGRS